MSDVYSGAQFTIIASRAAEVNEGLLHDRLPLGEEDRGGRRGRVLHLPCLATLTGQVTGILAAIWPTQQRPIFNTEPLDQLAWAFQERLFFFTAHGH